MTKTILNTAVFSLLIFLLTPLAYADLYIDAGVSSNTQQWSLGDYTLGSEFTVTGAPILFDQLGYIDVEGDGLEVSHQVGLWRVADQALLASVLVNPTSSTEASEQGTAVWYVEDIGAPISLNAGTYRVGAYMGNGDAFAYSNDQVGNGVTVTSGYVRTSFPGGFNYPNLNFSSNGIRVTVGLSSSVPEPGTFGLLAGLGGLALVRRRRR